MGSGFLELLKSITIFLLAGQVILRFLPEGGYEKYARILIGVMVLSRLALPLLSLGGFDAEALFSGALEEYEQEMRRIESQVEQAELKEGSFTQDGLEGAVSERLDGLCAEWGVRLTSASLDEDGILCLTLKSGNDVENEAEDEISIDRVEVDRIRAGDTGTETPEEQENDAAARAEEGRELKAALAQELGMEPEKLEVILDG